MMSLLTVEGDYKDGRVELAERPAGIGPSARVLVTFLSEEVAEEQSRHAKIQEQARRAAGRRLLALIEKGVDLGGPPYPKREELYDRVNRLGDRLDGRDG
jgi:hypothetical protein